MLDLVKNSQHTQNTQRFQVWETAVDLFCNADYNHDDIQPVPGVSQVRVPVHHEPIRYYFKHTFNSEHVRENILYSVNCCDGVQPVLKQHCKRAYKDAKKHNALEPLPFHQPKESPAELGILEATESF